MRAGDQPARHSGRGRQGGCPSVVGSKGMGRLRARCECRFISGLFEHTFKIAERLRAWRRPTLPPLERQYHWRSGFSRPSSGWDRVFGPALWPPGRQGYAAPRRPVVALACGVGGGRGLSCARGGNVLARLWGPPFPAFAGTGLTGACCRAGARQQGFAAVRGGIRRRRSAGVKRTLERLVPVSCAGCPASTSGLSTWWSSTALGETWF